MLADRTTDARCGLSPGIRRRCEEFVRPLYAGLDGVQSFDRVQRVLERLDLLAVGSPESDPRLLELLALFHGAVARLGSLARGGRFDLFLRSLGLEGDDRARLRRGIERFGRQPKTAEEQLLHDAVLLEEAGVVAAVGRLLAAGKKKTPAGRAVEALDAGPPAERFHTEQGAEWGSRERLLTESWIADLRRHF